MPVSMQADLRGIQSLGTHILPLDDSSAFRSTLHSEQWRWSLDGCVHDRNLDDLPLRIEDICRGLAAGYTEEPAEHRNECIPAIKIQRQTPTSGRFGTAETLSERAVTKMPPGPHAHRWARCALLARAGGVHGSHRSSRRRHTPVHLRTPHPGRPTR